MGNNIVAIVGRPNVGKSTLFNRFTGRREAIVKEVSGVTRDRLYGHSFWGGKEFSVIDTGGYIRGSEDVFEGEIRKQVEIAIDEADIILFVLDGQVGITDLDQEVTKILRKTKKNIMVVANKIDTPDKLGWASEFYQLGLGEVFPISSTNGSGTGELLDEIIKHIEVVEEKNDDDIPKISIVGKPNVGKSSLTNALLGVDRNIVTEVSGTTRDAINTRYNHFGFEFDLIDTAGIRKKAKVHEDIEYYSVLRSIRSIENSDVCIFMVDALEGLQKQDLNIFYIIEKNRKGVVLLVNKWDLIESEEKDTKKIEDHLRQQLAPFNDVPILFVSALTKQRIFKALEKAMEVYANRIKKVSTSKLNEVMLPIIQAFPPAAIKGKYIRIKYVTQLPTHAPAFAFYCNLPQYIQESYKRFIEKKLREHFDFEGVPLRVFFRKK